MRQQLSSTGLRSRLRTLGGLVLPGADALDFILAPIRGVLSRYAPAAHYDAAMRRLPSLGPRGEGWVVIQFPLLWAIIATGFLGPAWDGGPRLVTAALGAVLIGAGLYLAGRGISDLGRARTPLPHPRSDAELVQTGIYRLVRHPIYGGLVIAAFGWGLLTASPAVIALAAVLFVFFELKSRREEMWLVERFPDYPAYRARTRRLIPWIG